jgi:hypothetical protein
MLPRSLRSVTRHSKDECGKRPGHFGRDDPSFCLVLFPKRLRAGLTCDAPLALRKRKGTGRYIP